MTEGAEMLRHSVKPKISQKQIAVLCGVSQQAVSGWISGRCRPSREAMVVLERELGIAMSSWTSPISVEDSDVAA